MFFKKKKEDEKSAVTSAAQAATAETAKPASKAPAQDEEVAAAISLALSLYLADVHDYERMVITMQKVMRPYSPWSSKIYGLRKYPR